MPESHLLKPLHPSDRVQYEYALRAPTLESWQRRDQWIRLGCADRKSDHHAVVRGESPL